MPFTKMPDGRMLTSAGVEYWLEFLGPKINNQPLGKRKKNWSLDKLAAFYARKYPVKYQAWITLRLLRGEK